MKGLAEKTKRFGEYKLDKKFAGKHLTIDAICYTNQDMGDKKTVDEYLYRITKIAGMTLVYPPISAVFPFSGEIDKIVDEFSSDVEKLGIKKDIPTLTKYKEILRRRREEGAGISGISVWLESHIALHSWTEENYISLDLFTCNDFDIEPVIQYTASTFGFEKVGFCELNRYMGEMPDVRKFHRTYSFYMSNIDKEIIG